MFFERSRRGVSEPIIHETIGVSFASQEQLKRASEQLSELELPGYDLKKEIGRGTFGVVWEAIRHQTGQRVAVKVLLADAGMDWSYFNRELSFLRDLEEHPHTLTILDAQLEHDPPFLVTPLVEGGSLEQYGGASDLEQIRIWIRQVAETIEFIHSKGVIHCDLKPSNVFVSHTKNIRVGDFGQARTAEHGRAFGTLGFMSPEQCSVKGSPSVLWDVYSFGATVYWLLTGQIPYDVEYKIDPDDPQASLEKYRSDLENAELVPIRTLNPKVSQPLAHIIEACLRLKAEDRTSGMREVLKDLDRAAAGDPLHCLRPWKASYLSGVIVRKRSFQILVLVMTIIAWLAYSLWQDSLERRFRLHTESGLHAQESGRLEEAYLHWLRALDFAPENPTALARLASIPVVATIPHDDTVRTVSFESSGKFLASSGDDGVLRVSNTIDGTLLWKFEVGEIVPKITISPNQDWIGVASWDGKARIVSMATGELKHEMDHTVGEDTPSVIDVAFSHDSKILAAADELGNVKLWNVKTGQSVDLLGIEDPESVSQHLSSSPDVPYLAALSAPSRAQLWSFETGQPVSKQLSHEGEINAISFSTDGEWLATAGDDRAVKIWTVPAGDLVSSTVLDSRVNCVLFTPDGRVLIGCENGVVTVWDPKADPSDSPPLELSHRRPVIAIDLHQSLPYLSVATGERENLWSSSEPNGTVWVWDLQEKLKMAGPWAHDGPVESIAFHPVDKQLVSASGNGRRSSAIQKGKARIWRFLVPKQLENYEPVPAKGAKIVDSRVVLDNGTEVTHGDQVVINSFDIDETSGLLATASADRTVKLWNTETGERTGPALLLDGNGVGVAFDSSGRWLATAAAASDENGRVASFIRVWDVETARTVALPVTCHEKVRGVKFSEDSRFLMVSGTSHSCRWEVLPLDFRAPDPKDIEHRLKARIDKSGTIVGL